MRAMVAAPAAVHVPRRRPFLATILAIVAILEAAVVLVLGNRGDVRFQIVLDLASIGFLSTIVLFPLVGALILRRRPQTAVAWLMCAMGIGIGTGLVLFAYGVAATAAGPDPLGIWVLLVSQLFFIPCLGLGGTLILLLFPTDRLPSARWRAVIAIGAIGVLLNVAGALFAPTISDDPAPPFANPIGASRDLAGAMELLKNAGNVAVVVAVLAAAASLLLRYRRADATEAAQIRWLALVGSVAVVFLAISALQVPPVSDIAFGVGLVVFSWIPIAIGIAITRYRLYEIDRLINRALVYGSLTAILAGVFTAAIGLAQRLFIALTKETSDAAIVGATLVVATLYAPLRKQLETIVDRRFKYDQRRFGPYLDDLRRVLSITSPGPAATRLALEAARELGVTGAAVMGEGGRVVATAGLWPPASWTEIPIATVGPLRAVLVGPRTNGQPPDAAALEDLRQAGSLAASGLPAGR